MNPGFLTLDVLQALAATCPAACHPLCHSLLWIRDYYCWLWTGGHIAYVLALLCFRCVYCGHVGAFTAGMWVLLPLPTHERRRNMFSL